MAVLVSKKVTKRFRRPPGPEQHRSGSQRAGHSQRDRSQWRWEDHLLQLRHRFLHSREGEILLNGRNITGLSPIESPLGSPAHIRTSAFKNMTASRTSLSACTRT